MTFENISIKIFSYIIKNGLARYPIVLQIYSAQMAPNKAEIRNEPLHSILGDSSFDTEGFLGILTPLRIAVLSDKIDLCRFLVEAGADVFAKCDESGASMMHYAALNATNGLELIDFFGSLGLKANVKDRFGEEPIHYAIRAKNIEIAKVLLQLRQENAGKNNLLHFCVVENNLRLAQIVLECEEEMLDQYGDLGKNTIQLAARNADLQMCKWLVGKGANLQALSKDEYEDSVVHSAALNKTHGSELVAYFVSELGFDVNAKDKLQLTPLHYALQNEFIDVAEVLVTLGADLDALVNSENLLQFCEKRHRSKSIKFLQERETVKSRHFEEKKVSPPHSSNLILIGRGLFISAVVVIAGLSVSRLLH